MDFLIFRGEIFWGKIFLKCLLLKGHFFGSIFWGKKFVTNCSPFIGKNPGDWRGRGFRAGYGGVPGGICLGTNEKAPGVCGISLRRHVLAPLIHGN